jgi:glycosyltransferase involved in cell wall biosynthesis
MPDVHPKCIAFICSTARMSGVEFSLLYLLQRLDRAQWRPVVFCPEEGDLTAACREIGVAVERMKAVNVYSTSLRFGDDRRLPNPAAWTWNGCTLAFAAASLARGLSRVKPQLVITKGAFSHLYGGVAARRTGIPCIWHLQDFVSERHWGVHRWIFGRLAERIPTRIVVDGTPIARQLPAAVQNRTCVVYNGVDDKVFRPGRSGERVRREYGIPSGSLVIGSVARLSPWKGQHYLIEAFARMARELPGAVLLLVGSPLSDSDRYEKKLRQMAAETDCASRILFAGRRTDLPEVLAAMDVFVHTATEKDTSPLALLSAMASGLPVVAFDIEGVREVIRDGSEGLLVARAQTNPLAEALLQGARDARLRERLGAASRRRAEETFSLRRHCELMERVFAEACGCQPGLHKDDAAAAVCSQ